VAELPEQSSDGNGGRGVPRFGGRPTTLTRELRAQIVALVGEVGALATAGFNFREPPAPDPARE
jgi:hypothetical protein